MTFASSADPLPASWYRLPQDTYTLKARSKAALVNPLVVTFTASGWPRNGGVPFNMATRVENGNDLPLKGIKETLTITLRFLGQGYEYQQQLKNPSSCTRQDLFCAASNALTSWVGVANHGSPLKNASLQGLHIASIYFPSTANIAQLEIIVAPSLI